MTDQERMLEKIRRLLALANMEAKCPGCGGRENTKVADGRVRCSECSEEFLSAEHEAALAAAKAQELLHKYNLTLAQVTDSEKPEYGKHVFQVKHGTTRWKFDLLNVVAQANGASVIRTRMNVGDTRVYAIVAQAHVVEVVSHLYYYLEDVVYKLSQTEFKRQYGAGGFDRHFERSWRSAFRFGVVDTIQVRLAEQKREFQQETAGRELILANDKAVQEAVKRYFPRLKSIGERSGDRNEGYWDGRAAGKNIALNRAVKTSSTPDAKRLT